MGKGSKNKPSQTWSDGDRRFLGLLATIGGAAGLWGAFLWRELLSSRSGGDAFCGFGGGSACAELWDGPFAAGVHDLTGVPLAGWGVIWGLVAALLPILALRGRGKERRRTLRSAIWVVAVAGIATVAVLLLASAVDGKFCQSCGLTYLLTIAYAAVASRLRQASGRLPPLGNGFMSAVTATFGAYLLLLYPGLSTPKTSNQTLADVVERAAKRSESSTGRSPAAGKATAGEETLESFLATLPEDLRQGLANSLAVYRGSSLTTSEPPRSLMVGSPQAKVRITDFTDALCSHCATLHETLEYLKSSLPGDSFSLDARQFPLDGHCNPHLRIRGQESVRCLAARARICLEGPNASAFASALYENQERLKPDLVYRLATPFLDRGQLERCVASTETAAKLRADVDYAWRYRPPGTPLVLVNGRQGTAFGPFLYAIVLAEGNADHPAFATLPPPSPASESG